MESCLILHCYQLSFPGTAVATVAIATIATATLPLLPVANPQLSLQLPLLPWRNLPLLFIARVPIGTMTVVIAKVALQIYGGCRDLSA